MRAVMSVFLFFFCLGGAFGASVPQQMNYQGKVDVNGVPYNGVGQFKFAIVDTTGTLTLWSNDGTSIGGGETTSSVSLNVADGLFSVRLGDTSYGGMTQPLTPSVFDQPARWLRIWFSDGTHGFQRLGPDQQLSSVPYAMMAATVADGAITGPKLARESVWPEHEGRSNTIVSYFATYNVDSGAVLVGTVPTSKTLVITDIVFGSGHRLGTDASVQVEYVKDSVTTVLYLGYEHTYVQNAAGVVFSPTVVSLRAGLPVPGGAELYVRAPYWSDQQTCILSGFEFGN